MASFDGRALFAALVTVLAIFTIILIIMVFRRNRTELENQSIPTRQPCTVAPSTPINLSISNPQGDLLVLEFSPVSTATSYVSQISNIQNFNDSDVLQEKITTSNSSAFGNLALGTSYYFRVKARNSCGESNWSIQESFRVDYNFPNNFVIVNENNPGLKLCGITVGTFSLCPQTESYYFYNENDKSLRKVATPNDCLTRLPGGIASHITCDGGPAQKWSYDGLDKSVCDYNDLQNGCLKQVGTSTVDNPVTYGPKNTPPVTTWLVQEV